MPLRATVSFFKVGIYNAKPIRNPVKKLTVELEGLVFILFRRSVKSE